MRKVKSMSILTVVVGLSLWGSGAVYAGDRSVLLPIYNTVDGIQLTQTSISHTDFSAIQKTSGSKPVAGQNMANSHIARGVLTAPASSAELRALRLKLLAELDRRGLN